MDLHFSDYGFINSTIRKEGTQIPLHSYLNPSSLVLAQRTGQTAVALTLNVPQVFAGGRDHSTWRVDAGFKRVTEFRQGRVTAVLLQGSKVKAG